MWVGAEAVPGGRAHSARTGGDGKGDSRDNRDVERSAGTNNESPRDADLLHAARPPDPRVGAPAAEALLRIRVHRICTTAVCSVETRLDFLMH